MTATHHPRPADHRLPWGALSAVLAIGLAMALGVIIGESIGFGSHDWPLAKRITATPVQSTLSKPAPTPGSRSADDRFLALVTLWANRDGYTLADRDTMISAGGKVCALVGAGRPLSQASAGLVSEFGLAGDQAQALGLAAVNAYCPLRS